MRTVGKVRRTQGALCQVNNELGFRGVLGADGQVHLVPNDDSSAMGGDAKLFAGSWRAWLRVAQVSEVL
jgi:hypothetical protein